MVQLRLLLGLALAVVCATAQGGGVTARMEFACLWWSEAQMNGLNPNAPPPKTTDVRIKQWEYTDPVGVPHPDVVDAVLLLSGTGAEGLTGLEIEFTAQWKIWRYGKPRTAVWGAVKPMRIVAAAGEVRLPVDLKTMMDTLEKQDRWPFALRVSAVVKRRGATVPLVQARGELPIRQGD
jgi:hypothetical protein